MTLEEIIRIADDAYDFDALVEQYFRDPTGNHGDGLAKFVALELMETYDVDATTVDQLEEARRVIQAAERQLACVAEALGERLDAETSHQIVCSKCYELYSVNKIVIPLGALYPYSSCAICSGKIARNDYHWMEGNEVLKAREL